MANLPPIIAAARIGSVGVKQAEMTNADMNEREGKRATIMPVKVRSGICVVYTEKPFTHLR